MTDQDNLRDRIRDSILAEYQAVESEREFGRVSRISDFQRNIAERYAQVIIDEFGLTVHGDDCGYHEIHGSYDTRFEEKK